MADTPDTVPSDDLSALAWVHSELRRSLENAHKALRRHLKESDAAARSDLDTVDPAGLRAARTQIHQGVGALELVGLPAAARVLRASEMAVQRMLAKPALVTEVSVHALERASFALLDYLGRLLAGKTVSPVGLFPQYATVQAIAGSDRIHPADLWEADFAWHDLPAEDGVSPRTADDAARGTMEAIVLRLMRNPEPPAWTRLSSLCAELAAAAPGRGATLWRLAAAFAEAEAASLLPQGDLHTKRVAARLLAQLRLSARHQDEPSERLAHDLLFFCAHARQTDRATPRLDAVRRAWQLRPLAPIDYEHERLGRFDPAWIAQARKRVAGAKDVWSAVAGGEQHRLAGLAEQMALMCDSVDRLFPSGAVLSASLRETVARTVADGGSPPAALAMEVATAVLYLDATLEDGELDQPDLEARVKRLAQRIDEVRGGGEPQPLESWMEELYRRVSDRQTMGSVVHELRASLSEVEKQIDQYFRDPSRRELLIPVPSQLSSMRGVLSVLGMDQASQAVLHMRDDVDALAGTEVDPEMAAKAGTFDRLADNLGALSFLIDMLSVQPQLAKSLFKFDPQEGSLTAVMGQAARPSAFGGLDTLPAPGSPLADEARRLAERVSERPQADHRAELDVLAQRALAADQPAVAGAVSSAQRALAKATDDQAREAAVAALRQTVGVLLPPEPLPPPAPAPAPVRATVGDLDDDPEMRDIFLEEAREVIDAARASLGQLVSTPDDVGELTTVRRAFHTLKGSSRMVGLRDFGEAAWACEQLYNARLAQAPRMDPDLQAFTAEAFDRLAAWTDAIAQGSGSSHQSGPIVAAADVLRAGGRRVPIAPPAAPAMVPPAEGPAEATAAVSPAAAPAAPVAEAVAAPPAAPLPSLPVPADAAAATVPAALAPETVSELPVLDVPALPELRIELPEVELRPADTVAEHPAAERAEAAGLIELDLGADLSARVPGLPAASELDLSLPPVAPRAEAVEFELDLAMPGEAAPPREARAPGGVDIDVPELGEVVEIDFGAFEGVAPVDKTAPAASPEPPPPVELSFDATLALARPIMPGGERAMPVTWPEPAPEALGPSEVETTSVLDADLERERSERVAMPSVEVVERIDLGEAVAETEALPLAEPAPAAATVETLPMDLSEGLAGEEPAPEPEPPLEPPAAPVPEDLDEQVKVIGPLRIPIPLFNIYLNEADELSRRLCTDLAEWSIEYERRPVSDNAVVLAHSLAGSSATVGYAELSSLARALEHTLVRSIALGRADGEDPVLFNEAADEIRRLLHQFAAGFLRPMTPGLLERLHDRELRLAETAIREGQPLPSPTTGLEAALEAADEDFASATGPAAATATEPPGVPFESEPAGPVDELQTWRFARPTLPAEPPPPAAVAGIEQGAAAESTEAQESLEPPLRTVAWPPPAQPPQPQPAAQAEPQPEPQPQPEPEPAMLEPAPEPEPEPEPEPAVPMVDEWPALPAEAIGLVPAEPPIPVPAAPLPTPKATTFAPLDALPAAEPLPRPARSGGFDDDEDIEATDAIDAELFPIFEEEAEELLPQLHSRLRDWALNPSDTQAATGCMRTLHTFKGGARLAGAMRLGEMAHRLESAVEHLGASPHVDAAQIDRLLTRADAIGAAFDAMRRPTPSAAVAGMAAAPAQPVLVEMPIEPPAAEPAAAGAEPAGATGEQPEPAAAPPDPLDWSRFTGRRLERPVASERPGASTTTAVRVRAGLLDRLVNHAGEVSITRARLDADVKQLQGSANDLTDNLDRLRRHLRDIELQAESQIASRIEAAKASAQSFDPLEMDRFTRFQELTRMMAESVNDVATVQRAVQRTLQSTEDELAAQARLTRELQDDLLSTRMVEFESLADRLYRVVRQAAKDSGKQVRLDIVGGSIEVDRGVLERMIGPFEHLLRNCVAHGIELPAVRAAAGKDPTGLVRVTVTQEGNEVGVDCRDDGAGLDLQRIRERAAERGLIPADRELTDAELVNLIFQPGFTTAGEVTELAGRGVGLDVVRAEVNAMGGRIETASAPGQGSSFKLVLPLTTAVTQVVMLRCGDLRVAVPSTLIEIVRRVPTDQVERAYASGGFLAAEQTLPFYWLGGLLQHSVRGPATGRSQPVVIVRSAAQRVALHVDEVIGNQEVVVKHVGPQLARLPGLAGVTLLPSGAVALIYNPVALASLYGETAQRQAMGSAARPADGQPAEEVEIARAPLVLVVDDSLTVRRVTQRLLVREGYRVALAKDGMDALEKLALERPAVMLSDIEMPRMDGFDLLRNVRTDPRLASLPVVMITSRIAQKHRDYAAELGANHYLGKPYSEEELMELVTRYAGAPVKV